MVPFIANMVMAPELIRNICSEDVNEAYLEYIVALNKRIVFCDTHQKEDIKGIAEVKPELEKLKLKVLHMYILLIPPPGCS